MKENLNFVEVLKEGIGIGVKNLISLIIAVFLWIITIWIPYLNVGTTIAIQSLPMRLCKGEVISPTFIFDGKYRQYMGEYFTLIGLQQMALIPAFIFFIVPGIIISLGWSLALYIMLDKEVSPSDALLMSNKATYGNKWTIFLVGLALMLALVILVSILGCIPFLGGLLIFIAFLVYMVTYLGCCAVIYKKLVLDSASE